MLTCYVDFVRTSSAFGDNEWEVFNALGISYITTTKWWAGTTTMQNDPDDRFVSEIFRLHGDIHVIKEFMPRILDLLKPDYYEKNTQESTNDKEKMDDTNQLTVILVETSDVDMKPERAIMALDSINQFYQVYCKMNGGGDQYLALIGCDSGSDKSFDFRGSTEIIGKIKQTALDVWQIIVFHKEIEASKRIKLVAESLPVLLEIDQMKKKRRLNREEAEILRRQTIDAATQFIESGIILPEIEDSSIYDPRVLLSPSPRLLAGPEASDDTTKETGD